MCGEQHFPVVSSCAPVGSPPRVRGTVGAWGMRLFPARITPACAGNSIVPQKSPSGSEDHPRVCGEQHIQKQTQIFEQGSPPRMRGTETSPNPCSTGYRITPACAGNSIYLFFLTLLLRDHPRVCGEQTTRSAWTDSISGSPPRVRGTVSLSLK